MWGIAPGFRRKPPGEVTESATVNERASQVPQRQGLVLATLILVAAVANLNLAVANVALPDIGDALNASQTGLNLVAVGYSLGLATSVLYFGAIGDRYGRKTLLILGTGIAIPASLLAALSPSVELLFLARLIGGLAAGMAFPTTLALITALWSGPARTRSIALWSGIGGAISALGPLLAGALLLEFEWGSVFLLTVPLALAAVLMAIRLVPAHVNETSEPVDNLGGILSLLMVAAAVLAINFAGIPGAATAALGLAAVGIAATVAFVVRQRRAANPLFDLAVAGRRTFWVAAVAGVIVFGTLMAAMFVGQQYLQNVLGYSTWEAGLSIVPAALAMVVAAPLSARLVNARGSRVTLLTGFGVCLAGFVVMFLLWDESAAYWRIGLGYLLVGAGVGLAGTPASNSLTGSVPVSRAGMASGTADLQRDLGGAIMQSILGVFLTAGYSRRFGELIASAPGTDQVSDQVQAQLERSFSSASAVAEQHPKYADQIIAAARESFLKGEDWAYAVGIVAVIIGLLLVWFVYPRQEQERELLAGYGSDPA